MFAFPEYAMSLTWAFVLGILRNTLEKKKTLNKKTDHIWTVHGGETEGDTCKVPKPANSHKYLKTFLKIQNSRMTEHEFS